MRYICLVNSYFSKQNYILLIAGTLLVVLGYVFMMGGGSEDPQVFNPEIFSTQRITIAPLLCLLGFVTILFGIMYRQSHSESKKH
jgi:uncharacterized membrane protein